MFASRFLLLQLVCITIGLVTADYRSSLLLPPGYIHHSDIQTAYKLHTDEVTWENAVRACALEGARLAVIDTQRKVDYVTSIRPWGRWVWTAIYKRSWLSNNWETWPDVQLASPLPWSILNLGLPGNCVAVSGLMSKLGSWPCSLQKMYVCEIPDLARGYEDIIVAK